MHQREGQTDTGRQQRQCLRIASRGKNSDVDLLDLAFLTIGKLSTCLILEFRYTQDSCS